MIEDKNKQRFMFTHILSTGMRFLVLTFKGYCSYSTWI